MQHRAISSLIMTEKANSTNKCHYHDNCDALDICYDCSSPICLGCKRYEKRSGALVPCCRVCLGKLEKIENDKWKKQELFEPYRRSFSVLLAVFILIYCGWVFQISHVIDHLWIMIGATIVFVVLIILDLLALWFKWFGPTELPVAQD
jgi:hypothetical protein